jgi:uncharacterized DUF497 family protein
MRKYEKCGGGSEMEKNRYNFSFSPEKNRKLIETRKISFEQVIEAIEVGPLVRSVDHPNQDKYPGQMIALVSINDYIFMVPYVKNGENVFLKTIIPSRKATKDYLKGGNNNESEK